MECADWFKPTWPTSLSWRFQFPHSMCVRTREHVCRVAAPVSTWVWLGRGKEGWEIGGQPTKPLSGFSSPFHPPQQVQGKFPPVTSSLLCSRPGAPKESSLPHRQPVLSPIVHILGHPQPVQMGPSVSFSRKPSRDLQPSESLPILWPHSRCSGILCPAMLSNCVVVTDSLPDEWTFRSHHPDHDP